MQRGEGGWIRLDLPENVNIVSYSDQDDEDNEEVGLDKEIEGKGFVDLKDMDVVKYIAGYIAFKLGRDIDDAEYVDCEWIDLLNDGKLKCPSKALFDYCALHRHLFEAVIKYNTRDMLKILKDKAAKCDSIIQFENGCESLSDKKLCNRIRDLFFKCMIRARVNALNEAGGVVERREEEAARNQRRKYAEMHVQNNPEREVPMDGKIGNVMVRGGRGVRGRRGRGVK